MAETMPARTLARTRMPRTSLSRCHPLPPPFPLPSGIPRAAGERERAGTKMSPDRRPRTGLSPALLVPVAREVPVVAVSVPGRRRRLPLLPEGVDGGDPEPRRLPASELYERRGGDRILRAGDDLEDVAE